MKKPKNRMAAVETLEPAPEVERSVHCGVRCPKCGGEAGIISERMQDNRVIRKRKCEKCQVFFTSET